MQNDTGGLQSVTCHVKCNASSENVARVLAPATQNDFCQVVKHAGMSQSATPATQNEAMRRWKAPKVTPFAELTRGTAIATSRERLRTVADGCEPLQTVANGCKRLRTVARRLANTAQPPHPQSETGTIATHSGKIRGNSVNMMNICRGSLFSNNQMLNEQMK